MWAACRRARALCILCMYAGCTDARAMCIYYVCMRAAQMPSLAALYVRPGQVWAVGDLGRSPPLYVRPGQVWAVGDLGRSPQCEPCGGSGPCTTTNHSFHLNVEARCHLVMLAIRQLVNDKLNLDDNFGIGSDSLPKRDGSNMSSQGE